MTLSEERSRYFSQDLQQKGRDLKNIDFVDPNGINEHRLDKHCQGVKETLNTWADLAHDEFDQRTIDLKKKNEAIYKETEDKLNTVEEVLTNTFTLRW